MTSPHHPPDAIPLPPIPRPPRPPAPRRRWPWLVAVLFLGGIGVGVWWWQRPVYPIPPLPTGIEDAEVRAAIEAARKPVLEHPQSGTEWGNLGLALLAHLFDREADECFAQASRLDPEEPRWPYGRALIALKRAPDKAVGFLREAVTAAGDTPSEYRSTIHLQLAEALLDRGELDEAEKIFRAEQRREPSNPRIALGLGLIAVTRGKDEEALPLLTRARTSLFARKVATAQLARIARLQQRKADADGYDKELSQLSDDPPWPDPLLDRLLEMQVGRRGRERRIDMLENQHRYAEVLQIYLAQIKEQPTSKAYVGAGVNMARIGDRELALPLLRKGVELDPESAQAHYSLALVLYTLSEQTRAANPEAPQLQAWLKETVEHARRATELKPGHGSAYLFWGLALRDLGQPRDALPPLRLAVTCLPANPEVQLALGQTLLDVGAREEAERHLRNAAQLAPKDPRPARALEQLRAGK